MDSTLAGFYENWGFQGRTCEACPAQSTSNPGRAYTPSDCTCNPGYYMQSVGSVYSCASCDDSKKPPQGCDCNGYFGSRGSNCKTCPENSNANRGASVESDCKCMPGYYQKSNGGSVACLPCPEFAVPFFDPSQETWTCNCTVICHAV